MCAGNVRLRVWRHPWNIKTFPETGLNAGRCLEFIANVIEHEATARLLFVEIAVHFNLFMCVHRETHTCIEGVHTNKGIE